MPLPPSLAAFLHLMFSLNGRAGRRAYWTGVFVICLTVYLSVLAAQDIISLLLDLCAMWFILAVGAKRFRDFGWDIRRFCAVLVAGTLAAKIWDILTPATPEHVTDITVAVIAITVTGLVKGKS
jgi:uncharacterized membrane protein YhaH (DUF805 family)